jgi:MraZ protein
MGFSGEFPCALEERFRTTFPSRWREELRAEQRATGAGEAEKLQLFLTKGPHGALWGFTPQGWERFSGRLVAQLKGVSVLNKEALMLRHLFLAPVQEVVIDRHARMLVPEALRTYAGLEGDVVWVGSGPYFELYGKARWQQREAEIAASLASGVLVEAAEKFNVTVD